MQLHASHCNCCGLPIAGRGQDCPRCGYPIELTEEMHFLERSLKDLGRVAVYGGAALNVSDLMSRYQRRLSYLSKVQAQPAVEVNQQVPVDVVEPVPVQVAPARAAAITTPLADQGKSAMDVSLARTPAQPAPVPQQAFSFQDFFADQSINIVASLGAFLILVGSLSFIATTPDFLLAFLVLLGVHAFFGATGAITFRFPQVRTVSIIYTAIFALQVPLVGFSFYRLLSNVQLTAPTLIAIAAAYATLAYSSLAIYQRFQLFGYLAAAALAVTDVATASALHLQFYWWPYAFLLLAFPLLVLVRRPGAAVDSNVGKALLSKPGLFLMYTSVIASVCVEVRFILAAYLVDIRFSFSDVALRASVSVFLGALLVWICAYIWLTRRYALAQIVPYLVLACVFSLLFLFQAATIGFILVLTILAGLCWLMARQLLQGNWPFKATAKHLDILVIALVVLVAYLSDPAIIIQIFSSAYQANAFYAQGFVASTWFPISCLALLVGSALLLGVVINHVGWQKPLTHKQSGWMWLVLLAGLVLNDVYTQMLLWSHLSIPWGLCCFALGSACIAGIFYRWIHPAWSYPLAALALCVALESLLMGLNLPIEGMIVLLLVYTLSSYALACYLNLPVWLLVAIGFASFSLIPLSLRINIFLLLSLLTPLLAAGLTRWEKARLTPLMHRNGQPFSRFWAAYVIALLYGVAFGMIEYGSSQVILTGWLPSSVLFILELALLGLIWYGVAAIDKGKWPLFVATGFGLVAVMMPDNHYWWLLGVAIVTLLIAAMISRLASLKWALPWYVVAIGTVLMMGLQGSVQGWDQPESWSLLFFALLVYLVGVIEHEEFMQLALLWTFAALACWAVYVAGLVGDLYRPPLLTLIFAIVGVGIRSIRSDFDSVTGQPRHQWLRYALPLYATALFAAALTGIQGMFNSVNTPFYAAIPLILFVYALTAYGISLLERKRVGLWLVVFFAVWGMLLLPSIVTCATPVQLPIIGSINCQSQTQLVLYSFANGVLLTCILGAIVLRLLRHPQLQALRSWGWIWYAIAVCDVAITCTWIEIQWTSLPLPIVLVILTLFTILAGCIMFLERIPALNMLLAALAIWTIVHLSIPLWGQLELISVFFLILFGTQYMWQLISNGTTFVSSLQFYRIVPLVGQFLIVSFAFLSVFNGGDIAHSGAFALLTFAILIAWWGRLQTTQAQRHYAFYIAGFLCTLTLSWELWALGQTELTLFCTPPAIYLIAIAPFISRDEKIVERENIGHFCSIAGASLLLGPTLLLSFQHSNVAPSLLLASEAIFLLMLGFITHTRFFVLSSAALIIVAAIHVLFLPSLGIPTFMALFLLGILLVILATTLLLVRTRLTAFWQQAD
ncbi:hypothetical protein KDA_03330 [Dictyobacter alpinus]|uniref:Uncharacterized protein n=1 Tax=Dictyobacter alpinus TaxID=2014873 RepID=A0A402B0I1_9CHLR|nr:hypothetical protein [Dictyobacter alpinus]GCE24849.1 hypothetical protein KDA_03330 [Dictyobacter alpinus]